MFSCMDLVDWLRVGIAAIFIYMGNLAFIYLFIYLYFCAGSENVVTIVENRFGYRRKNRGRKGGKELSCDEKFIHVRVEIGRGLFCFYVNAIGDGMLFIHCICIV